MLHAHDVTGARHPVRVTGVTPLEHRTYLAVDPSFDLGAGLRIRVRSDLVEKDARSPLIRPQHPWEVSLGYTQVCLT